MDILIWVGVGALVLWLVLCWLKVIPDPYAKWSLLVCGGFIVVLLQAALGRGKAVDKAATDVKIDELAKPTAEVAVPDLVGPTAGEAKVTDKTTTERKGEIADLRKEEDTLAQELKIVELDQKLKIVGKVAKDRAKGRVVTNADEPDDDVAAFITDGGDA